MPFDGDFFRSQGPPGTPQEIFPTSGFSNALTKIRLDLQNKSGNIRLIIGPRGIGKSTCLDYLATEIKNLSGNESIVFDAGIHIPRMLGSEPREAANLFFEELASAISRRTTRDIALVIRTLEQAEAVVFLFVDNLDRLYEDKNDLDLVRYIFKTGDPTFKALSKRIVMTFTAAPEWEAMLAATDLGYLNYKNRVILTPITSDELEGLLEARARQRGRRLVEYCTSDFVKALHVASQGNPRSAVQLLETIASSEPTPQLPLTATDFRDRVPEELFRGAVEKLRGLCSKSPEISWGVNQLSRYFHALEKGGTPTRSGVAPLLMMLDRGETTSADSDNLAALAHVAHRIDNSNRWELNPPVKKALQEWGRIGLSREVLLAAFAQNRFSATTTDVHDRAEDFTRALEFDIKTLHRFQDSVAEYGELEFTPFGKWDRRALVQKCWGANQRLMQSVLTIATGSFDADLDSDLRDPKRFYVASRELIEEVDKLYAKINRHNIHKAELLAIRERVQEVSSDATSLGHWEDYQVEHLQKSALKAYESLIRTLPPRQIAKGGAPSPVTPAQRLQRILDSGDRDHIVLRESYAARSGALDPRAVSDFAETCAALMNSDGGVIAIGVGAPGHPCGLLDDYALATPNNRDGLRTMIQTDLRRKLGPVVETAIRLEFLDVGGKDVCLIHVGRANKPVYIPIGRERTFLRRSGGSNVRFNPSRPRKDRAEHTQRKYRR